MAKKATIPALLVNNNLISNFREKTNIFNDFFCSTMPTYC